jgi:hypothetical protein
MQCHHDSKYVRYKLNMNKKILVAKHLNKQPFEQLRAQGGQYELD